MDFTAALRFVTSRLHPSVEPCLTTEEVSDLVDMVGDGTGVWTAQACYRALVEGWTMKHGRATARFDFTTDGQTFRRSQVLDHIEDQRQLWVRKLQASPSTLGRD